jgi:hypothetical protein
MIIGKATKSPTCLAIFDMVKCERKAERLKRSIRTKAKESETGSVEKIVRIYDGSQELVIYKTDTKVTYLIYVIEA